MINRKKIIAFGVLLFGAVACFAQSSNGQKIILAFGESIKLRANAENANGYQWLRNGVNIEGATQQDYIVNRAGIYAVITFGAAGCSSDISESMEVELKNASADVSITKRSENRSVVNYEPFKYYLLVRNNGRADATDVQVKDALPENLSFSHFDPPSSGEVKYNPSDKTILWSLPSLANGQFAELIIHVSALRAGRVVNSATVTINEFDPDPSNNTSIDTKEITGLKIPNVFTPNGDGKNDTFFIERLDAYADNELTVINRWGSTVYEKNGYLSDWTGDGLADGTYFYVLKVKNAAGNWEEFKGYVTLIR
ncbi:T9SS type B sorting domain-containing protein [Pedobacter rhizosphaerae]|uniref:Conserved repeat domain-containing protein/gliding motility-associated C-terminal domain-containing protein n=1 Tax=Pedobacter rhizosphaerae TaxID=390241 RepID=A0A1H9VAS6_9SPHI|nr:gliding motility-associated C-terminal domain-containing protein [Pedobacter rhizosphaerae]SES18876.1 conserved repeat domain-containing protein/gliding motility-associated C-terminal domain-containing protein [Pedobacter rhizosphaerae]